MTGEQGTLALAAVPDGPKVTLPLAPTATQLEAANLALPRSGTARAKLYDLIVEAGERGVTDEEAQWQLGMSANTQRPRRNELMRAGLIKDSGRTRQTRSGARATVWVKA